jgi:hypothetical protein
MKLSHLFAILLSVTAITACAGSPDPAASKTISTPAITENNTMPSTETTPANDGIIRATGLVQFQDLEGGFWGIVADDGRKFDALNLEPSFQKEGLPVRFEAKLETDRMSTRMWGTMITLTHIEVVK